MKIFITGVTGYIGGSVAEKLLATGHEVTGLVRSDEKIELLRQRGIRSVKGALEDTELLMSAALDADVVINAASADDPNSVFTLIGALERTGKTFIHTSGSAIVADDADGAFAAEIPVNEDMYFEPMPFRRRRIDMNHYIREAALGRGVRAMVICPTMIYGRGRGLQRDSDQIPKMMALSKQVGAGVYFGEGLNHYSNVHIDDLVDLYVLAIEKAPGGSFFFAENGHNSFHDIAVMISQKLGFGGETVSLPVAQLSQQYGEAARLGVASNSYVEARNARRLGWAPHRPSLPEWFES